MSVNGGSLPGSHNITRVELNNGITILVYENYAAQSVVIAGSVRAGSLYEITHQTGRRQYDRRGVDARHT